MRRELLDCKTHSAGRTQQIRQHLWITITIFKRYLDSNRSLLGIQAKCMQMSLRQEGTWSA